MLRTFLFRLLIMAGVGVAAGAAFWLYSVLSKTTAAEKLEAFEVEVKSKGGKVFRTMLGDKPMVFLLLDCSLFRLDVSDGGIERTKVLSTGFYFWLDTCTAQSIRMEGEFVQVYLANRAIGAGGGNTTGGTYRSKDGETWEKNTGQGWHPLSEAQQ